MPLQAEEIPGGKCLNDRIDGWIALCEAIVIQAHKDIIKKVEVEDALAFLKSEWFESLNETVSQWKQLKDFRNDRIYKNIG